MSSISKKIILFVLLLAYFLLLQGLSGFGCPDSFYHTKMALLMKGNLVIQEFPWLQFSNFRENFIDHHWLFHIFLIPAVSLQKIGIEPLLGVRLWAILAAAIFIFILYLILEKWQIQHKYFFVIVALISGPFVFRISLARAPAWSGVALILGIYFLIKQKKYWPLFFVSFFYVWLHASWVLLPFFSIVYVLVEAIAKQLEKKFKFNWQQIKLVGQDFKKAIIKNSKKVILVWGGTLAGLIINPYFPTNLKFYYDQIWQIAVLNKHNVFTMGSEWYPYHLDNFFKELFVITVLILAGMALFVVFVRKQNQKSWFLFLLTSFFLVYTFKARRSLEYLVPVAILFLADLYDKLFFKKSWSQLEEDFKKFFSRGQQLVWVIIISLLILITGYFTVMGLQDAGSSLRRFKFNYFQDVSNFLKNNTEPMEIIFNVDWDHFGFLFYNNSQNYYITGLDQTFMYRYNPELLRIYEDIYKGNITNLKNNILKRFKSHYVVLAKKRDKKIYEYLEQLDKSFEKVYDDREAAIFKVIEN